MSEQSGYTNRFRAAAIGLGLLLGGVSCSADQTPMPLSDSYSAPLNPTTQGPKRAIEACFDQPLANIPGQTDFDGPHYNPPLLLNTSQSQVEGDPEALRAELATNVLESVVVVESELGTASGFITKDARGESVVVTAAHVVAPGNIEDITVYDNRRQKSTVTAGCYVFENRTGLVAPNPNDSKQAEHDIAILKLTQPLGQRTLNLSLDPPKRGEWVIFSNYQKDSLPPNIVSYSGLVLSNPPVSNYQVVTGIHGFPDRPRADANKAAHRVQGGASGGPVLDLNGDVVGELKSSDAENRSKSPGDMQFQYDVTFNDAVYDPTTGFEPSVANITPSFYIQQALESPKLR